MGRRTNTSLLLPFPPPPLLLLFFDFLQPRTSQRNRTKAWSREQRVGRREAEVYRRLAGMRSVVACRTRRCTRKVSISKRHFSNYSPNHSINVATNRTSIRGDESPGLGRKPEFGPGENGLGLVVPLFLETRFLSLVKGSFSSPRFLVENVSFAAFVRLSRQTFVNRNKFSSQAKWRIANSSWRTCFVSRSV